MSCFNVWVRLVAARQSLLTQIRRPGAANPALSRASAYASSSTALGSRHSFLAPHPLFLLSSSRALTRKQVNEALESSAAASA